MMASPLCDGKRFTAALERAYEEMWRRWRCGEHPLPSTILRAMLSWDKIREVDS